MSCGTVQTKFEPVKYPERLPIYEAIKRSNKGINTVEDDATIGSRCSLYYRGKRTYCSLHPDSAACACVNSNVPYPHCVFGPCKSMWAYKPILRKPCPNKVTVCNNLSSLTGRSNLGGVAQAMNCGGTNINMPLYEIGLGFLFLVALLLLGIW